MEVTLRECDLCGGQIPQVRLEALPNTRVCVECSSERARTVLDVELDGPSGEDMVKAVMDVPTGR